MLNETVVSMRGELVWFQMILYNPSFQTIPVYNQFQFIVRDLRARTVEAVRGRPRQPTASLEAEWDENVEKVKDIFGLHPINAYVYKVIVSSPCLGESFYWQTDWLKAECDKTEIVVETDIFRLHLQITSSKTSSDYILSMLTSKMHLLAYPVCVCRMFQFWLTNWQLNGTKLLRKLMTSSECIFWTFTS